VGRIKKTARAPVASALFNATFHVIVAIPNYLGT